MIDAVLAIAVRIIAGVTPRWVGCQPEVKQRIYFANHTSHFDAVVLWAILPEETRRRTRPVAAKDYWAKSKARSYLAESVFRALLIEREKVSVHNNPLHQLQGALGEGASLILFPEGTRGNGEEIQPFKSGLYHLAKNNPGIEFVPVHIDNLNRILPKGETLPLPLLSCVSFGSPVELKSEDNKNTFLERARMAIVQLKSA